MRDASSRDELVFAEPVEAWNLPSEPWTFVIDRTSVIVARLEGTLTAGELADIPSHLR